MPGGLPKQDTRLGERVRRRVDRNERKGRIHAFRDGTGKVIENVNIAAGGSEDVYHGLKVRPRGWIAFNIRMDAAAASETYPFEVYTGEGVATRRDAESMRLYNPSPSEAMYFDLWVF